MIITRRNNDLDEKVVQNKRKVESHSPLLCFVAAKQARRRIPKAITGEERCNKEANKVENISCPEYRNKNRKEREE